jgi:hypothetical protein
MADFKELVFCPQFFSTDYCSGCTKEHCRYSHSIEDFCRKVILKNALQDEKEEKVQLRFALEERITTCCYSEKKTNKFTLTVMSIIGNKKKTLHHLQAGTFTKIHVIRLVEYIKSINGYSCYDRRVSFPSKVRGVGDLDITLDKMDLFFWKNLVKGPLDFSFIVQFNK